MAPYRNSRTGGARSTRTQIDHDVFEGLPVRHWRKRAINVNTAPEKENMNDMKSGNLAWPELDMPRDAHLLSEMSQNLLRAARMPQAKKALTAPLMEDDKEPGDDEDADGETDTGFVAKRWAVIPKDMEGPEPEFLAKRRKGLPSVHSGAMAAVAGIQPMRKTKIRKTDTSGNSSILEVLVPDGQIVDGEIFEEEISPTQAPAPGTVVEGVGVVNAEGLVIAGDQGLPANNRRRPPPPKRKPKGPGRGRKKKVAFAGADGKPTSIEVNGVPFGALRGEDGHMIDGTQSAPDQDTIMGEDPLLQDGEEGSEEGSEGEEGEEGDREEGELSPSASPPRLSSKASPSALPLPQLEIEPPLSEGPGALTDTPPPIQATEMPTEPVTEPDTDPIVETTTMSNAAPITELATQSVAKPFTEPDTGPVAEMEIEPGVAQMEDTPDEILDEPVDEILDVPSSAMANEPTDPSSRNVTNMPSDEPGTQPQLNEDGAQPVSGLSINAQNELLEEPTEEPQMSSEVLAGNNNAMNILQAVGQLPMESIPTTLPDPIMNPVQDVLGGSTVESQAEPILESAIGVASELEASFEPEPSMDVSTEPEAVLMSEFSMDGASESKADPVREPFTDIKSELMAESTPIHSVDAVSGAMAQSTPALTVDPTQHLPLEVMRDDRIEPTIEPNTELLWEPTTEAMSTSENKDTLPSSMANSESQINQAIEVSMPAPASEPKSESMPAPAPEPKSEFTPEPVIPTAAEPFTEPVMESTERAFSFTRPTASPKAPTPSPPTPIEENFGLRAPYYSPKAPTMSPPTPIGRSTPSSPEMPLSEQHFQLPPQVDDRPEGGLAPAQTMHGISNANRIIVEPTRQDGPGMNALNAQIPIDHNPLDGLAAPKLVYGDDAVNEEGDPEIPTHVPDGEDDLLGSLERSLDRRGNGS